MKDIRMTPRFVARAGSLIATAALGAAVAGCSASATQPYPSTQVNPLSGDLQLAVGTANVYGDVSPGNYGLNVVETFRQTAGGTAPGDTDALVDTPTLSGPFVLPAAGTPDGNGATIETGPGPTDAGTGVMHATAQPNVGDPTVTASTFGVSTNASGLGLEPFNYTSVNGNNAGSPDSYVPYAQPLFDPNGPGGTATDINAFVPWGGPPAFDPDGTGLGVRDGNPVPPGVVGVSLGLDVFEHVTPVVGTYTLSVAVPTGVTSGGTKTATATLASATVLPPIVPATVVPDASGDGGAAVTLALPAGVTEAFAQIVDIGPDAAPTGAANCNGALASPVYYTLEFTASGTLALPPTIGPGTGKGAGSPSLCTAAQNTAANTTANGGTGAALDADEFVVNSIGYDYPAYELDYPKSSGNPAPKLTSGAQADITISSSAYCVSAPTLACTAAAAPDAIRRKLQFSRHAMASRFHVIR
jgi:hypothetical protein